MTADTTTLVGARLGSYRLVRRLGKGGMGRVYLAVSPSGRAVAVKVLLAELREFDSFRSRFRAEIAAARKVSGAYTAAVVDADPDGTPPWLATVYVAGPSLKDAVAEFGPLRGPDLVRLAAGTAEALAAIHKAGLIHRDLTPANVLLADNGPRVIDFGISRLVDEHGLAQPSSRVLGVPGYMAPERIRGEATTTASDVFSLGAVVTFAAQGRSPFGDATDATLLERTLDDALELDGVPSSMKALIGACLDKDPSRRPPSQQLAKLFGESSARAWTEPLLGRIRRDEHDLNAVVGGRRLARRVVLLGGAALVAATSAAIVLADKAGGSSVQASGRLALAWSTGLPRTDMTATAFDTTTVVCTDRLGVSCFDLATGAALWSASSPQGVADSSDGERVYSVGSDGRMDVLDARNGRPIWVSLMADHPAFQLATPTMVVVTAGGLLQGIAAGSGVTRWTYSPQGPYLGAAGAEAQRLIIYSSDTAYSLQQAYLFTVLDLDSGQVRWSRGLMDLYAPPTGDVFYALDTDMNLLALRAADGATLWSAPTALPSESSASLSYLSSLQLTQGTLFCYPGTEGNASGTGILTAFDPGNGRTLWSVNPSSDAGGYAVTDQVVCYLDGSLKAVSARTGAALWSGGGDLGLAQLAGAVNGLFVAAAPGTGGLYGWDAKTGQQVWHYPVGGGPGRWSFLHPSSGLLASQAGRLYYFRSLLPVEVKRAAKDGPCVLPDDDVPASVLLAVAGSAFPV